MSKSLTFRLDVTRFERETRRLGPAVVGAYMRLMIDYFEQGESLPDDDVVLARIAGVDPDMWKALRVRLEPLFQIEDGGDGVRWFHDHVAAEIEAQRIRTNRAQKAANKAATVHTENAAERKGEDADDVQAAQAALNEAIGNGSTTLEVVGRTVAQVVEEEDDLDEDEDGIEEPPVPQPIGIAFESGIDPDFKPTGHWIVEAQAEGYTTEQIASELDAFKRYNHAAGTTSNNWPEMWNRWWNRKKPPLHPAEKKPKPRVQVSRRAPPPPSEPA